MVGILLLSNVGRDQNAPNFEIRSVFMLGCIAPTFTEQLVLCWNTNLRVWIVLKYNELASDFYTYTDIISL